jgi:Rad3-related DNA helicase
MKERNIKISLKQAVGRLLRPAKDYGYFKSTF